MGLSDGDRERLRTIEEKRQERKALSQREEAFRRRVLAELDEAKALEHYAAIPQKVWRQFAGVQTKQLHDQAARYDLPIGGPTIDLEAFVHRFHRFLAENAVKLARDVDAAPNPAQRLQSIRADREQIKLEVDRQRVVDREAMHELLTRCASLLRGLGDDFKRRGDLEPLRLLNERLDSFEREIAGLAADADDHQSGR